MPKIERQTYKSQTGNIPLDEMWLFIDSVIKPHPLVLDRSALTYEQVVKIYSKISEVDEMFREFEHVQMLKKGLEEEKNQRSLN